MKKITLQVWGRVQGVGFRYMTKLVADQLGILGTVQNKDDGSVYIEAIGTHEVIEKFIEKIKASPSPSGHVERWQLGELTKQFTQSSFRVIG